jgi:hypothetical protein
MTNDGAGLSLDDTDLQTRILRSLENLVTMEAVERVRGVLSGLEIFVSSRITVVDHNTHQLQRPRGRKLRPGGDL